MAGDIYYEKTVLLLPLNGSNGGVVFTDYSKTPKTVTPFGNAQTSSSDPLFGENVGLFDGTGDYLSIADHADWDVGSLYTVEFFCKLDAAAVSSYIKMLVATMTVGGSAGWYIGHYQDQLIVGVNSNITSYAGNFGIGVYRHVALVWDGVNTRLFLEGNEITSIAATSTTTSAALIIANSSPIDANRYTQGKIANLRITKGVARYKGNFTPPTAPFPTYSEPRPNELYTAKQPIVQAFNPTIFNG